MAAEVIRVDDPEEVVDVLTEAFRDYPVMRYVLGPRRADYDTDLRKLVRFFVMNRVLRDEDLFGLRGDGGLEAAATTSRLGTPAPSSSPAAMAALADLKQRTWGELGDDARERYEAFSAACAPFVPAKPHLHLNMIGVRDRVRRRGRARVLLDHVHALSRNDPASDGVSLSTEKPENVPLYEHVGYVVVGHAVVSRELETWALYRPD
jgi:GNAT superfamily N-acetyltransferase